MLDKKVMSWQQRMSSEIPNIGKNCALGSITADLKPSVAAPVPRLLISCAFSICKSAPDIVAGLPPIRYSLLTALLALCLPISHIGSLFQNQYQHFDSGL